MTELDPKGSLESFDSFKELVTRFPNSKYTPDAILRMKYLVNALASLELHVARYYMKRGAYLAAANRAQYAVKNYPNAPATEEALFIMVKAYDALGLDDLRDDAERVMRKTYPDREQAGEIVISEKELSLLRTLRNQAVLAVKQSI